MKKPLRILQIVQSMNCGGIETMLMNVYRNIDRSIVQFDFMLSCSEKSDYEDEILKLGGKIYRMSSISLFSPNKYLTDVDKFFKTHAEYIIVHSHMNAVSALPLYIAKKNNIPIRICHSHTTNANGVKGILKWMLKYVLKYVANNYFACSKDAGKFLYGKSFFYKPKCYILNNAIDSQKYIYNPIVKLKLSKQFNIEGKTVIGHVGRFNPVKNHMFILEIFKLVHDKNQNTVLMLVGDGELRTRIEEKISALKLVDSVILTGVVSNVYDYLQVMDFYLFPSFFEGLGMSLIEAQASGLKCFVSSEVPAESSVSDLVEFISLSQKADFWAEKILSIESNYERKNMLSNIQKVGYDVKITSKWLQNYYIENQDISS